MIRRWRASVAEIISSINGVFESRREKLQAGSLLELATSSLELYNQLKHAISIFKRND